ncbi:MAG: O-antigen ligase domain-containing protein [Rhodobacteraceae bacterium]|nr:O-antigen ligase domain-containing protein [Paracoccaceae bacterium]
MTPQNPAERMVYHAIIYTWPIYVLGGLYILGPVLAWVLGALAALALYLGPAMRADLRSTGPVPWIIWLWGIGMIIMLVVLWIGHANWNFVLMATVKSSIGWAKGWALLALFPLIGAVLPIRREILVRGQSVLGLWIICLLPLFIIAPMIGLPQQLFTSPLKAVGGPGPEYFTTYLYTRAHGTGIPRWQFYAPWSPFAGLLGVVMVLFSLEEKDRRWMLVGVLGGVAMVIMSRSRMGLIALPICVFIPRMLPLLGQVWVWMAGSMVAASMAAVFAPLRVEVEHSIAAINNMRAGSNRVRSTLERMAVERWESEAFWFGHGRVAPGSHLVEFMPIGSHHTWFGLLFVKGLVGFMALALAFFIHAALIAKDAVYHPRGRLPLGLMMVLMILSLGENIEIEAYLLWPALMALGIHARQMATGPSDLGHSTD